MSVNIYNSNPNATSEEENFSCVADRGSKLASDTIYSNTTSGLTSVNVQGAIDEVNKKVEDNVEAMSQINSDLSDIYGVPLNSEYVQNLPTNSADDAPQGFRKGQNVTGQPSLMNEWVLYHTCYYDDSKLYGWQIAYHMNGYDIAYRYKRNGVWVSWKYIAFTS